MYKSEHLGFELSSAARMIKRSIDNAIAEKVGPNVSSVQCRVICLISAKYPEPVFRGDIEAHLKIRRSTATELLQLMEKNGLITNASIESDARKKQIMLTEKANEINEKITSAIEEFENKLSEGIGKDEQLSFMATIRKIKNNIDNQ